MLPISEGWTFDEIKVFANLALLADYDADMGSAFPDLPTPTTVESWAWAWKFVAQQLPDLLDGISDDRLDEMRTFYLEKFHV